eukprot:s1279_g8.t1
MALLKLRYRNSFIDAEDETSEVPPRRTSSLPPFRVCDPLMEEEEDLPTFEVSMQNYVENLSQQWQTMSPMDLRSPSFPPTDVDGASPTSDSTLEASVLLSIPTEQAGQPVTPGSLGHPEVCRRQCIYFLQGHCSNGDACTYCHLPHTQRAPKLDKRQRTIMQALSHQEVLALMLHLCTAKAEEVGMLKEAHEVISILTVEANGVPLPSMSERETRALCKTLSRMQTARSVSVRPWNECVRKLGRKSRSEVRGQESERIRCVLLLRACHLRNGALGHWPRVAVKTLAPCGREMFEAPGTKEGPGDVGKPSVSMIFSCSFSQWLLMLVDACWDSGKRPHFTVLFKKSSWEKLPIA